MTDIFRPSCQNVRCSGEETLVFLIQFCAVGGSGVWITENKPLENERSAVTPHSWVILVVIDIARHCFGGRWTVFGDKVNCERAR
ncbi:uncharacterized protein N7473_003010 [Penicillium subrubescens]|uniref:uncharacterized protein n=1 Tax=Penicillium subrubescens TaxID=1316194 RepID=UPI00254505D5|nr:uncharacterized protein N7473_003010 [Penicillium subrubescens]KAJ5906094.1 hypothetical protein N7473_003010 [Penicillium subrubescens]